MLLLIRDETIHRVRARPVKLSGHCFPLGCPLLLIVKQSPAGQWVVSILMSSHPSASRSSIVLGPMATNASLHHLFPDHLNDLLVRQSCLYLSVLCFGGLSAKLMGI